MMARLSRAARLAALAAVAAGACVAPSAAQQPPPTYSWKAPDIVPLQHPDWSRDAILYQLNTRQFTREGTFRAAEKQLPRLKKLGVDIIWLMPIHPIGEKNRKGSLGSPYSVKDYYAVNPELGSLDDFKGFVKAAHAQDMKVIIDWVANHSAWDNRLATEHPDWYEKDWKGDFRPTPWWDWSDIIDFDWSKEGVRAHVGEAMLYWVRETNIDGFRADVAGYVPLDFWITVRARLEAIKPVFMLAEWKTAEMHKAFDATYAWEWHNSVRDIAKGKADATALYGYYAENESAWPASAMRMGYVENHDSNAWDGSQYEVFGDALPAMMALSFTHEGLPMVYNGQEACNAKRLAFFERDPIDWNARPDCKLGRLLADLAAFRRANPALANAPWGGRMVKLDNDMPTQLFSWVRQTGSNKVVGLFNLSPRPLRATLTSKLGHGDYRAFRTGERRTIGDAEEIDLPPWGFALYAAQNPSSR